MAVVRWLWIVRCLWVAVSLLLGSCVVVMSGCDFLVG